MNILLLQLKRIGDLILTTPAIAAVRARFPAAKISLVVASGTRELLPAIPSIDYHFVAHGKVQDAAHWFTVARRRYDYCLDFTHSDRSAFLTALSAAKKRITSGHATVQSNLRSLSYNILVNSSLKHLHTVDYHLSLLEPLGILNPEPRLQLHLPSSARAEADRVLAANNISGDFLLFHPGSARIEKFWEPERWSELIALAKARGLPCVVTGGKAPLEETHLAQIRARSGGHFLDLSGRIDLLTLAALIEKARLVTTVDSAPMHLAAALQTPQVVLFGPTNPLHWRPRFSPALILQAGQETPLTDFVPQQKRVPMNLISTAQVINAMDSLLAAPRGSLV